MKKIATLLFACWLSGILPTSFALQAQGISACGGPPSNVPPAERCMDACVYCTFYDMTGSTGNYQTDAPPPGFCGTVQNDQWIAFLAKTPTMSFTLTPYNCTQGNGLELALYETCSAPPLACAVGQAGGGITPRTVEANNLTPGKHYYLMVDGYGGDVCDFLLKSNEPPGIVVPPLPPNIGPIAGPAVSCPGNESFYEVPEVQGAGFYTWSSTNPAILFDGMPSPATFSVPQGRKVKVTVPTNVVGSTQICVSAGNACYGGPDICRLIQLTPIPLTTLPKTVVCHEDIPPDSTWTPGLHLKRRVYTSYLGCDSIVQQWVNIKPPIIVNLGSRYICKGSYLGICGDTLRQAGGFSKVCQSYQGCDSLVTGQIVVLNSDANISSVKNLKLTCAQQEVKITATPAVPTSSLVWRKKSSMAVVGTGMTITIKEPGIYMLANTISLGGMMCTTTKEFEVKKDLAEPAPLKVGKNGSLKAGDPSVTLKVSSTTPNLLFQWIGPQRFISVLQNPIVTVPGLYKVTATHPGTGCSAMVTILVD